MQVYSGTEKSLKGTASARLGAVPRRDTLFGNVSSDFVGAAEIVR